MNAIFEVLVLFFHSFVILLIYRQCSGSEIKTKWLVAISLVLLFGFFYFPFITYFFSLIFLVTYTLYRNKDSNRLLDIFYGLYPVVVENLFYRIISFFVFPFFGFALNSISQNTYLNLFVELSIYPIYLFLTKSLKINFKVLKGGFKSNYLIRSATILNCSMAIYLIMIQMLLFFENQIPLSLVFRKYLVGCYLVFFLVMLVFLNASFSEKLEKEMLHQKDFQIREMEIYSKQIEALYQELRSFRHDYINILTSIKSGLELRDVDAIEKVYEDVLVKSGKKLSKEKYDIANLSNLKDSSIKSILSSKILEAQSRGIFTSIEISEEMTINMMDILDFITLLSILCDNAIEASEISEKPKISIALIREENKEIVIVENSTIEEQIEISTIFNRDYSTKGSYRGIGLANVKDILEKYPRLALSTKSSNFKFRQTIIFNGLE